MKKLYFALSKPRKIVLLSIIIPLSVLFGWIVGWILGLYAINFFPEKCVTQGMTTTCGNSFEFLGQSGYLGTSLLGALIGSILVIAGYVFVIVRWEKQKSRSSHQKTVKNLDI